MLQGLGGLCVESGMNHLCSRGHALLEQKRHSKREERERRQEGASCQGRGNKHFGCS